MAELDNRGRPLTSPRPKSREQAAAEQMMNAEYEYDMLNRGLLKDPIAYLGFDPNMVKLGENPRDAYFVRRSDDLAKEDTVNIGGDYTPYYGPLAHESRHRGFVRLNDMYNENPEAFVEKYGQDAVRVLTEFGAELQTELYDNPEDPISSTQTMADTLSEVTPYNLEKYRDGGSLRGIGGSLYDDEGARGGLESLRQAALDALEADNRKMPVVPEGEEKGFFARIFGFAEGGEVKSMEQQMSLFEEGGLADDGMTREPVTGNEIPAGSMAEEVRDDIDAKLSAGEYVVPADVVRFFGVKFFEDLRAKAKSDMMAMEDEGRVGGEPVSADGIPMEDDELTPEEEAMLAEAMAADKGYASGGYVPTSPYNMSANPYGMGGQSGGFESRQYVNTQTGETRTFQFLNGQPISMIPAGFVPATPEALAAAEAATATPETATEGTGVATGQTPSGNDSNTQVTTTGSTSGSTNTSTNYGPEDVQSFVNVQNPLQAGADLLEGGNMGKMIGGGLGLLAGGGLGLRVGSQIGEGLGSASNISKAAANAEVADILGYDTTELNKNINDRMEELGMISGSVAAGLVDKARADARQGFYSVNAADAQTRDLFQSDDAFNAAMEEVAPDGMVYDPNLTTTVTDPSTGQETTVTGGYTRSSDDSGSSSYAPTTSPRPTARPSDLTTGGASTETSGNTFAQGVANFFTPNDGQEYVNGQLVNTSNDRDSGSDSGSSGGGKIVCTAMNSAYGFGSYRQAIWLKYSKDHMTPYHEKGYHKIFLPLVDRAYNRGEKNNMVLRKVLENIARHRTADIRAETQGKKRDFIGRIYRAILEPTCYIVGRISK